MPSSPSLPAVASLWIGDSLNWLHELSLASFVQRGHEVVLFHTGPAAPPVPPGVRTCPAAEIWDPVQAGHGEAPASMLSDLFRLYLLKQTEMIWIDTDMLCCRPLPDVDYHVGYEPTRSINGAVLRLPKGSATLNHLLDWFEDPEWVPPWLGRKIRKEVEAAPPGKRLLAAFELQRPSLGPRALDYTLNLTGEVEHVREPEVFYPIRGVLTDVLFSGHCQEDGWLTENTLAVHLYASMVRRYHKTHRPEKHSFIARHAQEIGFDLSGLKHQKQGNE
ncbi:MULTISPECIES: hypothetical protein [unclassified Leisingera]|uniref:hypothetical protein n=1 Tax=unclassified Leisingera TaxID=2614906 RepID=UPI001010F7C5|nr:MULTISPECIES: hypothetical protein [unclassified Leisingera]MCF6431959.1 hypothetical protein [Leisingera sp. MMG026]QAX30934.1 hypothetical protein ETW24_17015 [Leisingera sp. NJS204]